MLLSALHGSDLFVQHIPQILDCNEIWGIWRPTERLKLVVMLLKPFLNHFCFFAGSIILLRPQPPVKTFP